MYSALLWLHNVTRWLVLLAGVAALISAYSGLFGSRKFGGADRAAGVFFTSIFGLQVVIGLILYFIGPWGMRALGALGAAEANRGLLIFFSIYHIVMMLIALGVAQSGYSRAKRAPDNKSAFRRAALGYTVGFILLFLAIPWGIRPLWPI